MHRPVLFRPVLYAGALFAFIMASVPQPPQLPVETSDKLQHIIAFVVLTLLARGAYPALPPAVIFFSLAAFGALIEFVQAIPVLHRDASFVDWLVDGLAVAVTLSVLVLGRAQRERSRPPTSAEGPAPF